MNEQEQARNQGLEELQLLMKTTLTERERLIYESGFCDGVIYVCQRGAPQEEVYSELP